ncbi:hydantoinase/oxoprolinase family protein [Candidatus Entotheonella palauensis]|uniref:hydantoinase/oxoprolinase family protein n=1 Tax=Candidatus Entotheonella palauensis TaxID=93172 RepID=UPI0011786E8B|nr:hydantoinase/oxoprolinase family protein [Candidatus Entotheonella palauensis]
MTAEQRDTPTISIGIDTGGTFTDLVLANLTDGTYHYYKLPTTAADPAQGILHGLTTLFEQTGIPRQRIRFVVLGTTIATNAVLEGKTAATGMITTRGFRDILELARQRRPHLFDLDVQKPIPPAARDCRIEVTERMAPSGAVVTPLDEDDVRNAVSELRRQDVEAVSICFLHAYTNPAHEQRTKALLQQLWPDIYVCTSSDVLAEFREFERFATTTVNASLMPIMDRYLEHFVQGIHHLGVEVTPRVMQSNGGAVTPDAVRRLPINTFFSGPAGGVIGSRGLGAETGLQNLITFDMGGTSTDVCLIRDGLPGQKHVRELGGFPVRTPSLDIHTIGAGGGSIAWVDAGGLLKVGPMSAGSQPGPAAYGRGGIHPTVTDVNILLGRLNPRGLLGGRMTIDPARAHAAVERELSAHLQLDAVTAAAGVLDIVNANMMGAVRMISVEQGADPRDFTLVAFGGAGPLHAADVARSIGMRHVLIPPHPGLLSAMGLLHADQRGDFSLTRLVPAQSESLLALNEGMVQLRQQAESWLAGEQHGEPRDNALTTHQWQLDVRYAGQNSELRMDVDRDPLDAQALAHLTTRFHDQHQAAYGYQMPEQPVEAVTLRLAVTVAHAAPPQPVMAGQMALARREERPVWFPETGFTPTPIYEREQLPVDADVQGPCIIEQMDTTTVVPPKAALHIDSLGNLHIDVNPVSK